MATYGLKIKMVTCMYITSLGTRRTRKKEKNFLKIMDKDYGYLWVENYKWSHVHNNKEKGEEEQFC